MRPTISIIHTQDISPIKSEYKKAFASTDTMKDFALLAKVRLSLLVVFSAGIGYAMAQDGIQNWSNFALFLLGGFLVTASANAFNQVIEIQTDRLMDRTKERPMPAGRMNARMGLIFAFIIGIIGISILTIYMNPLCGMLSVLSVVLYALAYTPLKKTTSFAVFVGAIPGALPTMIGWVAVTGEFAFTAFVIFFIQFIWQFPHFWAIAWVLDEDYKKAGFRLLPSIGGRDKMSAMQIVAYSAALIPIGLLPFLFGIAGIVSAIIIGVCGVLFTLQAIRLLRSLEVKHARHLMFGSFLYLPIVFIALLADKI